MTWKDILKGPAQDFDNARRKVKGKIDYLLNLNLKRYVEPSKEEANKLEALLQRELDGFLPNVEVDVEFFIHPIDGKYTVKVFGYMAGMREPMSFQYKHELFGEKRKKKDNFNLFESDNASYRRDDYADGEDMQ